LSLDNNGNVIFSFTSTLDPTIISYKKQLERTGVPVVSIPAIIQATSTIPVALPNSTSTATSTQKRS